MTTPGLDIVVLGLSITSSWGNGHATTYRSLLRELGARGHHVLFLERNAPWYAAHRDLPQPPFGTTALYDTVAELEQRWADAIRTADLVIIGSYVPDGGAVAAWTLSTAHGPVAFYDIDTPVTVAALRRGECEYLWSGLLPRFDLYLSFTGGPLLGAMQREFGVRCAAPLYCSVDIELYRPLPVEADWDLGYMGTYSVDRQPPLERLLLDAARRWQRGRFVVAGPQYPSSVAWPANVERIEHLPPARHCRFYNAQRFTLNVTRRDMVEAGHSPSVRLFEAAACGVPVISDAWPGIDEFFRPGDEILISSDAGATIAIARELPEAERRDIGRRARRRVLSAHTAAHRAAELESYARALLAGRTPA